MRGRHSWGSFGSRSSVVLVGVIGVVVVLEAVDIPKAAFNKRSDEIGEAARC